jgi:hypothetical protein
MVLTLASGEPQAAACERMVAQQTVDQLEHVIIAGLGNVEAHRRLYRTIEESAGDFDVFLKVDADMVLRSRNSVAEVLEVFRRDQGLDHAVFTVHDHFTNRPIFGLSAYSHRCSWPMAIQPPFVDPSPTLPGRKLLLSSHPSPVADHAPDPSEDQAWAFGVHRGLKIAQPGASTKRASYCADHWDTLRAVVDHYHRSGDQRLLIALAGALAVLENPSGAPSEYRSWTWTDRLASMPSGDKDLLDRAERIWASPWRRRTIRARALGVSGEARVSALEAARRAGLHLRQEADDGR